MSEWLCGASCSSCPLRPCSRPLPADHSSREASCGTRASTRCRDPLILSMPQLEAGLAPAHCGCEWPAAAHAPRSHAHCRTEPLILPAWLPVGRRLSPEAHSTLQLSRLQLERGWSGTCALWSCETSCSIPPAPPPQPCSLPYPAAHSSHEASCGTRASTRCWLACSLARLHI